jgi:hypothetical protein
MVANRLFVQLLDNPGALLVRREALKALNEMSGLGLLHGVKHVNLTVAVVAQPGDLIRQFFAHVRVANGFIERFLIFEKFTFKFLDLSNVLDGLCLYLFFGQVSLHFFALRHGRHLYRRVDGELLVVLLLNILAVVFGCHGAASELDEGGC